MTITPERLAELRKGLATSAAWGCTIEQVNVEELRDLLDAADNLAALLAAAERAEVEWAFTLGELVKHTDPLEHKMRCEDHDVFRAAIRRAKGEQP